MYEAVFLVHLVDIDDVARIATVARLRSMLSPTSALALSVEPTLPGVRNGGDVIVRLRVDGPDQRGDARVRALHDAIASEANVRHVDTAGYAPGVRGSRDGQATIYRTLLLRVSPDASPEAVLQFESGLLRMPRFVTSMISWQLSTVSVAEGTSAWTHVWEQEFTDMDGLLGQYLAHPVHWGYVDKWFDPESPECIVRDRICHSFCMLQDSALSGGAVVGGARILA